MVTSFHYCARALKLTPPCPSAVYWISNATDFPQKLTVHLSVHSPECSGSGWTDGSRGVDGEMGRQFLREVRGVRGPIHCRRTRWGQLQCSRAVMEGCNHVDSTLAPSVVAFRSLLSHLRDRSADCGGSPCAGLAANRFARCRTRALQLGSGLLDGWRPSRVAGKVSLLDGKAETGRVRTGRNRPPHGSPLHTLAVSLRGAADAGVHRRDRR